MKSTHSSYHCAIWRNMVFVFIVLLLSGSKLQAQAIGVTSQAVTTTLCAGANVNVTFTISGTFSNSPTTNTFTAELSDANGSFSISPVAIGTKTGTTAGTISCTLPAIVSTSALYRIRVTGTNPAVNGSDNGVNLTVNAITLLSSVVTNTSFCQGETFTFNYTQSTCGFLNSPTTNIYSVQLSDATGSFASPTTIGTRTAITAAAITCTIPSNAPAGTAYRIRIAGSNPAINSPDNGTNLIVYASAGTPTVFGNGTWDVYNFNILNNFNTNYQGFYTDNNLSVNTATRFGTSSSPSTANGSSGLAYSGCPFGNTQYSVAYKRTNITCGYYQIDIPSHDDNVYILINGVTVFQHIGCCDAHTNVWSGIIQPTDQIELRYSNNGGPGNMAVNLLTPNPLVTYPITICASTTASLHVTNTSTLSLTYAWTPTLSVSPTTGSTVAATPTASTVYTVAATDAGGTGCYLFSQVLAVTINSLANTTSTLVNSPICSGYASSTLTASGANSFTWSPSAGLNTTSGNVVIASPTVTTIYTVTGSNNCSTVNSTKTVSVQTVPASPTNTTFGNNVWNVYCYNTTSLTNYYGYYTENNLSFTTTTRWGATAAPSSANSVSGSAFTGCTMGVDYHSTSHRRTNFPCGYYQIDIPNHYENVTLYINGSQAFQHIGSADSHTNVWSGFLGTTSTVEFTVESTTGNSLLQVTFTPFSYPTLSAPVTICALTTATLTAGPYFSGVTYSWSPPGSLSTTSGTITVATPSVSTNYTCTMTDPTSGCSISSTTSITTNPTPATSVTPTTGTLSCSSQSVNLTASGANTYSWSPAAGLNTTTGNSVTASPSVTTVYTVTGSNNCLPVDATATVSVLPLVNPTVFPTGTWNAYCYATTVFTTYDGYYTENGTGASGYDFNTATRWASGASPSTTNTTSGNAFIGCTMPTTYWSMSFKRTGFTCNTYSINILNHDDYVYIYVNGVLVASHVGSGDAHPAIWVGPLGPNSTVELRLVQLTATSGLNISFTPASTPTICKWVGTTSNDWFTSANWCGGIPTSSQDVLIYSTGTLFQPTITATGAICQNLTISGAAVATSVTAAMTQGSLGIGAFPLNVYGSWINGGLFSAGTSTVSLLGTLNRTITANTESFYKLVLNCTGAITVAAGTHSISNNLDCTSGIVTQNGILIFMNNATTTNANNNSYIVGQVVKYGTQAFDFPLGANNLYRPISITAPAVSTDNFTAQYFNSDPSPTYIYTSLDPTIDHIGRCEYWILNRTGGTSNVNVKMTWNTNSCIVNNLPTLTVARWDAGQVKWKDQGNGGTTGNTTAGSVVTSAAVTLFSPFTIASTATNNPLPIELVNFDVVCNDNQVDLTWSTASEADNDYYTVQRSKDAANYESVGTVDGGGNSHKLLNYSFTDPAPLAGTSYYRLKQTDFNGSEKYFKLIQAHCSNESVDITVYPNPTEGQFNVEGFGNSAEVIILNSTGQIILKNMINNNLAKIDMTNETRGIYFIRVQTPYTSTIQKLIVR